MGGVREKSGMNRGGDGEMRKTKSKRWRRKYE